MTVSCGGQFYLHGHRSRNRFRSNCRALLKVRVSRSDWSTSKTMSRISRWGTSPLLGDDRRDVIVGFRTTDASWASARRRTPDSRISVCRSEEHTSELQSLMPISYAVLRLTKINSQITNTYSATCLTTSYTRNYQPSKH